jgi:hypothetical protein
MWLLAVALCSCSTPTSQPVSRHSTGSREERRERRKKKRRKVEGGGRREEIDNIIIET